MSIVDKELEKPWLKALEYHTRGGRPGKTEVVPTKPCRTQEDLSLAYTPGVAVPCLEIEKNPDDVFKYTNKGNLVAVVSNGTAVLGLGDIGPLAGKPVMEGKGVLFKRFADVDVFDIELGTKDPDQIINCVKLLEPTFGGINLEDIKAPECFYIEETLKREMNIPVFHDDQWGTAIISAAALLNALEITGKDIKKIKVVFNGAGAAGIACAAHYVALGVPIENVVLCDSQGVCYKGREKGMNEYKNRFATDTSDRTLAEAMRGADVFVGVSVKDCVTQDMVRSMNSNPVVFAMANPDPEITYGDAIAARSDVIMATGRSDYPNQVNNVLGFPFIFRGALDVRSTAINDQMRVAATNALAQLAKEAVPDEVLAAYGGQEISFGTTYIIPKPFDPRVLMWESTAVAKAAIDTGVARAPIDIDQYRDRLEARLGKSREVMRAIINKARTKPMRIVYPEGANDTILHACQIVLSEGIATPVLLGERSKIEPIAERMGLDISNIEIHDHVNSPKFEGYAQKLYEKRGRKGMTLDDARSALRNPTYFAAMMVAEHDVDGMVAGVTQQYPDTLRPALQVITTRNGVKRIAGVYLMVFKDRLLFLADTTVNITPTAEELAEIAIEAAELARRFDVEPRVAMVTFSNFGSVKHELAIKTAQAVEIVRKRDPNLIIDGEMQADTAVAPRVAASYPFSRIQGDANVLVFSSLTAANVAYKLLQEVGGAEGIGPILVGLEHPVHVLQIGSHNEKDVVNMTAIAVLDAQRDAHK